MGIPPGHLDKISLSWLLQDYLRHEERHQQTYYRQSRRDAGDLLNNEDRRTY